MKKLLLSFVIAASMLSASAQTVVTLTGEITASTTWTNDKQYLLSGFVYVKGNVELTIQPGTVIKGEKSSKGTLIITRGSKLIANGTERAPIIFTSNEAAGARTYGDWGGIIILGAAPVNIAGGEGTVEGGVNNAAGDGKYGGTNANDNSGSLKYVRVEYPGIAFQPNNEINGITFAGVGAGTTLDHIQVSYSGDDAVEFFGGTVNAKHIFTFRSLDDNFDFDNGYSGMIQYGVSLVDPLIADASKSNGIECDNDATGTNNGPITRPNMQNMTILGPNKATGANSLFASGAHFRRATKFVLNNSIIMGYPTGMLIESDSSLKYLTGSRGSEFKKNLIYGTSNPVKGKTSADSTAIRTYAAANADTFYAASNDIMLEDAFNLTAPNFRPKAGSPAVRGADFTGADTLFFDKVSFRGAFGPVAAAKNVEDNSNWLAQWSNITPNATDYSKYLPIADFTFGKNVDTVNFINKSIRGTSYTWNFGDDSTSTETNPVHKYDSLGEYTVTLTAVNGTDNNVYTMKVKVDSTTIVINNGINKINNVVNSLSVYPNPVTENATVTFNVANTTVMSVNVYNVQGQLIAELAKNHVFATGVNTLNLSTENIPTGLYMVTFVSKEGVLTHKVIVQK